MQVGIDFCRKRRSDALGERRAVAYECDVRCRYLRVDDGLGGREIAAQSNIQRRGVEMDAAAIVGIADCRLLDAQVGYREPERRWRVVALFGFGGLVVGRRHDVPIGLAVCRYAAVYLGSVEDDFRYLETVAEYRQHIHHYLDTRCGNQLLTLEDPFARNAEILQIERRLREMTEQRYIQFCKIDRCVHHLVSLLLDDVADFAAQQCRYDKHQCDYRYKHSAQNLKCSFHGFEFCFPQIYKIVAIE